MRIAAATSLTFLALLALAPVAEAIEKPSARWAPASRSNYRRGRTQRISMVVIHTVEGSQQSCINTFQNPSTRVSAHYCVGKNGFIVQMVGDGDTAYHAGSVNSRAIGIEHEGFANRASTWTPEIYRASARLTRWLCDTYRIPIDRQHIIGHVEAPGSSHHDPGRYFDWDLYMRLVRGASNEPIATPQPGDGGIDDVGPASGSGAGSPSGSGTGTRPGSGGGSRPGSGGPNGGTGVAGKPGGGLVGALDDVAGADATTTPNSPIGEPRRPLLNRGSRGEHVEDLQRQLVAAGFPIKVDGIFGPETERAVRDFQRQNDCQVDGMVGKETWGALAKAEKARKAAATAPARRAPPPGELGLDPAR